MTTSQVAPPATVAVRSARLKRASRAGAHDGLSAALMVSPAVILLIIFFLVPVALAFGLAFTNARLISPRPASFTGLHNFDRLVHDEVFWKSLRNTAVFAAVVVPVQAGMALVLAVLVNAKVRGTNFFRTVYFLPVVTSIVVVSLLWQFMYTKTGLINHLLSGLTGGHVKGPDWLNDTRTALAAIIVLSIWQAVGFHMVIWLSGLQTIPGELYEAAECDGATPWQKFTNITWPGLRATRTFILVTITISALSLFAQINVMTQGGPLDSTTTVVYMAVRTGYQQQQTSYASAISLVFFALVLIVSGVQRFLTREKD